MIIRFKSIKEIFKLPFQPDQSKKIRIAISEFLLNKSSQKYIVSEVEILEYLYVEGVNVDQIKEVLEKVSIDISNVNANLLSKNKRMIFKYELSSFNKHGRFDYETYYGMSDVIFEQEKICPECGSMDLLYSSGEECCNRCGFVITDTILVSDYETSSFPIDPLSVENKYKTLFSNKSKRLKSVLYSIINSKLENHLQKNILPVLLRVSDILITPIHIKREAINIYMNAYKKGKMNKRINYESYVKASLILAYRRHKAPVDLKIDKQVSKAIKNICRSLNLYFSPLSSDDYLPYIISRIGNRTYELNNERAQKIYELSKKVIDENKKRLFGKNPRLVAAAAIYMTLDKENIRISQKNIADIAKVSNSSISRLYRRLDECKVKVVTLP